MAAWFLRRSISLNRLWRLSNPLSTFSMLSLLRLFLPSRLSKAKLFRLPPPAKQPPPKEAASLGRRCSAPSIPHSRKEMTAGAADLAIAVVVEAGAANAGGGPARGEAAGA